MVTLPPPGIVIADLPGGCTTLAIDGLVYHFANGVYYREAERRECKRWATTQPAALADASVFQRAVAACLEGRGYTVS